MTVLSSINLGGSHVGHSQCQEPWWFIHTIITFNLTDPGGSFTQSSLSVSPKLDHSFTAWSFSVSSTLEVHIRHSLSHQHWWFIYMVHKHNPHSVSPTLMVHTHNPHSLSRQPWWFIHSMIILSLISLGGSHTSLSVSPTLMVHSHGSYT